MKFMGSMVGLVMMGVIQGLTEFLPVSSSGHLVVGSEILHLSPPSLLFDVLLHVGTLLPVLWVYRSELGVMIGSTLRFAIRQPRETDDDALSLVFAVIVGSVPTALIGLLLRDTFERLFSNTVAVGCAFWATAGILLLTLVPGRLRRPVAAPTAGAESPVAPRKLRTRVGAWRAFVVGCAQGLAITPGISRSGTTIAAGLLCGLERELAARYSFLLSIPAIVGATLLQARHSEVAGAALLPYGAGVLAAALSGYLALLFVVKLVQRGELHWFALYLGPLGTWVLLHSLR